MHLVWWPGQDRLRLTQQANYVTPGQPYLLSKLVLLNELFELLGQFHVLLPQLGVVGAMLFHLHLNVAQGHLEVEHGLLPLLFVLPGPLGIFLLLGDMSGKTGAQQGI